MRCMARSAALRISSASSRPRVARIERAEQEVAEAADDHHHVVEVVRDSAGEPAHRLHFLGLAHLLLRLDPLGDVAADPHDARPPRRGGAAKGRGVVCMCRVPRATQSVPLVGHGSPGERPEVGPLVHGGGDPGRHLSAAVRPKPRARNPSRRSQRPKTSTQRWSRSSRNMTSSIDSTRVRNRSSAAWDGGQGGGALRQQIGIVRRYEARSPALWQIGRAVRSCRSGDDLPR